MENGGYVEEQPCDRCTEEEVRVAESIEGHVYEDISENSSKSDKCTESISLDLPKAPHSPRYSTLPLKCEYASEMIGEQTKPHCTVDGSAARRDFLEENATDSEVLNAEANSSAQLECQPGRKRRRKKDCKHCRHRLSEQVAWSQDAIMEKCQKDRPSCEYNIPGTPYAADSVGLLPAFRQIENVNTESAAKRDFSAPDKFPIKPANNLVHRTSTKVESNSAATTVSEEKKAMRVNSIYSQDRWYSKDTHIFFTDVQECSAFKRAYSFPIRTESSPVVQNRVNLRRSVRGEPPPEPATLYKHRHGWTLHFVKPLKKRGCSRALVLLIFFILALLGVGAVALYIMCEPERLRIIQQYLKSPASTNSSSLNGNGDEINSTRLSIASTEVVDMLLNGGGSLFSTISPTRELDIHVEAESEIDNFTRYCDDCVADEVCVALISEEVPICRQLIDQEDPTGCGGLCIVNRQKCHRLDVDAFRCLDIEHNCLHDEWTCSNALCIPLEKRCDGHMNCYDHSDEHNCICDLESHFRCGNETSCLPLERKCDGRIDCWDAADEINCTLGRSLGRSCLMENQFTCTNGECILKSRFCDGLADCSDGSDEPDGCQGRCNKHEFTCKNSRCITKAMKCNGRDDCGDGTDEIHCKSQSRRI